MALLKYGSALAVAAVLNVQQSQPPAAPNLTQAQVTAGVLYNLAMFVDWPGAAFNQTPELVICVARAEPVLTALRSVEGRIANEHKVKVRELRALDDPQSCHILYIPDLEPESRALFAKVASKPVLTVSDDERFLRAGGIIRLSFIDGRVKFDIDVGPAEAVGLRISSKVLSLARVVRNGRAVK